MENKNPRIHLTIDKEIFSCLSLLSKKKDKPIASIARELIMEAIQGEEDFLLGNIALSRKSEKLISHDKAWE